MAPHNAENSIKDEAATLATLGLQYTHIPVDFQNPTEENFKAFVAAITTRPDDKVWVHCAANMRVSAFMLRYRCEVLNENKQAAMLDTKKIWQPIGIWKKFLGNYQF